MYSIYTAHFTILNIYRSFTACLRFKFKVLGRSKGSAARGRAYPFNIENKYRVSL